MKKYLTYIFVILIFMSFTLSFFLWTKLNSRQEKIKNREQVISAYVKVIEAIGRTNSLEIKDLKRELDKDFDVSEKPYECCDDKLLYHTILTKDEQNWKSAGDYMGGVEIITDSTNRLITVMMFKP